MKPFLSLLLCLLSASLFSQDFKKISIYQYEGLDSLNRKLVAEEQYDSLGRLIKSSFTGYKEAPTGKTLYIKKSYRYRDTLLSNLLQEAPGDAPLEISYIYNQLGQKIAEKHEVFETTIIKKDKKYGMKESGGCVVGIQSPQIEEKREWKLKLATRFTYDQNGNMVLKESKPANMVSEDKVTYLYDRHGNLTETNAYSKEILIRTERYNYYQGGYTLYKTMYKPEEVSSDDSLSGNISGSVSHVHTCKLNDSGEIREEIVSTEDGIQLSKTIWEYNTSGRISRVYNYNQEVVPDFTHWYEYE